MNTQSYTKIVLPGSPSAVPPQTARALVFDHEKLDVYQLELKFIGWVTLLIEEASKAGGSKSREACDQLDRASLSALLNTAEGNGKRQRQVRAKYFDDARGSATECAACLDALVAKKLVASDRISDGKIVLARIVSILCELIERFDTTSALHEDEVEYQASETEHPAGIGNRGRGRERGRRRLNHRAEK